MTRIALGVLVETEMVTAMKRLVIGLLLVSMSSACTGLRKRLDQQELSLLRAQIQQADETASDADGEPDPEVGSQFSVFVPATLLNDLLKIASNQAFKMSDPKFQDVTVQIRFHRDIVQPGPCVPDVQGHGLQDPAGAGDRMC